MYRIPALLLLAFAACLFQSSCRDNPAPLRLATYTYATNDRLDNLAPLAKELERHLNRPVQTRSYPDVASFITGIRNNEVDVALINTLGYLLLALDSNSMEPVATLKVREDAADNYKTVLLTNHPSVTDLETLKDKSRNLTMQFVNPGSTSGNLVPRLLLNAVGIRDPESQFKSVSYGGNHSATLQQLRAGQTDVCAIGSNEYFTQVRADSSLPDSVRVLWISTEIPLGPVLLNTRLDAPDRASITEFLLRLHDTAPEVLESIKAGWSEAKQTERFYPISDAYYDDFRRLNGNDTDLPEILSRFSQ